MANLFPEQPERRIGPSRLAVPSSKPQVRKISLPRDLFYFLRTYASWVSRKQGCRDSLTSFAKQFLKPSSYLVLLQDVTQRYAHQISLAEELIEPLFYTCWMHRALKEAARLTTDQLEGGHYLNLLRLTIDQRNSLVFVKKQPLPVNALRETVHRYRP